jgi:hypothetical protein
VLLREAGLSHVCARPLGERPSLPMCTRTRFASSALCRSSIESNLCASYCSCRTRCRIETFPPPESDSACQEGDATLTQASHRSRATGTATATQPWRDKVMDMRCGFSRGLRREHAGGGASTVCYQQQHAPQLDVVARRHGDDSRQAGAQPTARVAQAMAILGMRAVRMLKRSGTRKGSSVSLRGAWWGGGGAEGFKGQKGR